MEEFENSLEVHYNQVGEYYYYLFKCYIVSADDKFVISDVLVDESLGLFQRRKFETSTLMDKITLTTGTYFTINVRVDATSPDEFIYTVVPEESVFAFAAEFNRRGMHDNAIRDFLNQDLIVVG